MTHVTAAGFPLVKHVADLRICLLLLGAADRVSAAFDTVARRAASRPRAWRGRSAIAALDIRYRYGCAPERLQKEERAMVNGLHRLRGRSVDELRVRATQLLWTKLEQLNWWRSVTISSARGGGTVWRGPQFLRLTTRDGGARVLAEDLSSAAHDHDREALAEWRRRADAIAAGRVHVLGHGELTLGNPPDWHRDPISGRSAPRVHWSRVPYLEVELVGDHKALWEPNRHQYLYAPALAWLIARRDEDFAVVQAHLRSWLQENPTKIGVNWASSLEVAYRAISWCWLLRLLARAPWDMELLRDLEQSLAAHAAHVERYLSTYFSPNTHLTGEALGLLYIGMALPHRREAARWCERGASILENSLAQHVREDGTYFEQATQYHRYTAEIYLHFLRLAESSGQPVSAHVREALASLFGVLRAIADGKGRIPLLGDDDGGQLLPLDHRTPDDVRGLLLAGAVALGRPELVLDDASPLLAVALCGRQATEALLDRVTSPSLPPDRVFPDGGLIVLRDGWDATAAVAVIDVGAHGALNCGHAHADALSMTLSLGRQRVFVDRGTATYTGPERNEFRSTRSHNTLEMDGESSAIPGSAFAWMTVPPTPKSAYGREGPFRWVRAAAVGHVSTSRPSLHARTVIHVERSAWLVVDDGRREGMTSAVVRWYVDPELVAVRSEHDEIVLCTGCGEPVARLETLGGASAKVLETDVSPQLGGRRRAHVIEIDGGNDAEVKTLLIVATSSSLPAVERSFGRVGWEDDAGYHQIMVHQGPLVAGLSALCWRVRSASDTEHAPSAAWEVRIDRLACSQAVPALKTLHGVEVRRCASNVPLATGGCTDPAATE